MEVKGTLTTEIAVSMLRAFQVAQLEEQLRRQEAETVKDGMPRTWRWAPGTFVFPEGLCCYCGAIIQSKAIWRAVDLQFYGSYKLVAHGNGTGRFVFSDRHPHVNNGSICMGSGNYHARSVADALFLALNPTSSYFGSMTGTTSTNDQIKEWLLDRFDHKCDRRRKVTVTPVGGMDLAHLVTPVAGCSCPFCRQHRNEIQCAVVGCGTWYEAGNDHGEFYCDYCERTYCVQHRHQHLRCARCRGSYDLFNIATGEKFAPPPIAQCKCGRNFCTHCREVHSCDSDCDHHCANCCEEAGCGLCDSCDCYPADCDCVFEDEDDDDELDYELADGE